MRKRWPIPGARSRWSGQTPTPVPLENFEKIPVVTSGPFQYTEESVKAEEAERAAARVAS